MNTKLLVFALALVATPAAAQETETSGVPFAAVFAEPGVPEFGPVKRMALEDPLIARIALPDTSQALSVVWGLRNGEPIFLIVQQAPDESSYSRFGGLTPGSSFVEASVDLELTPGTTDRTPLEVRVLPEHKLVLYRWPLSEAASAGGMPTAAPNPFGIGRVPPDLVVKRLDGRPLRLSDYRGRVVVLNWWSVTCAPCIEEMPGLNGLVDEFGDQAAFVAVGWDSASEVESLLDRLEFGYEHTVGDGEATALFGEAFPRHVVLDREGRVVFDKIGGSADVAAELSPAIVTALGI